MAVEERTGHGSGVGYAIVLLGAALFVATCFLPYYGLVGGHSVSLSDQSLGNGVWGLGRILLLFGGVAVIAVAALVGVMRAERPSGRAYLAGAVAAWSLSWTGSLLQTAGLVQGVRTPDGAQLEFGFWLQGLSIVVAIFGTVVVAIRRTEPSERVEDVSPNPLPR